MLKVSLPTSVHDTPSAERNAVRVLPRRSSLTQSGATPAAAAGAGRTPPVATRRWNARPLPAETSIIAVLRIRRERLADHDASLDPVVHVLDRRHARDDIHVAADRLRHVVERVGRVPDVRAGALDREGAAALARAACRADRTDVARGPRRRKRAAAEARAPRQFDRVQRAARDRMASIRSVHSVAVPFR